MHGVNLSLVAIAHVALFALDLLVQVFEFVLGVFSDFVTEDLGYPFEGFQVLRLDNLALPGNDTI